MQNRIHDFLSEAVSVKPDAVALIDHEDRSITWSNLQDAVESAHHLLKSYGIAPGDRVVLVFENCLQVTAFLYAISRLNAISVPVNARLTRPELERIFAHSDPSMVMFALDVSNAANEHAENLGATPVSGDFGSVALLSRSGSTVEPVYSEAKKQIAVLLYTSGTTGAPKAAMLTHGNLIHAAHASVKMRGMVPTDMSFLALPLSHIFGLITFLAICSAKAAMRLEAKFSVERLYDALQRDVTLLPAVPQMHAHLFHYARSQNMPRYDRGLLRFVSSGGAPLDPTWKREAEAFYGIALQNGYGLTECAAGVCATDNELGDPDISVGYAMLDSVLKLDMNATGANQEEGIGEVLVQGPQVMKGYFRDLEQTAKILDDDGVFHTGDLGRFDEEGRLHIVGRTKELIIRSGFNVYPVEIEAILNDHPEVVVAGVVGRAVEGNEEVLGFVKVDEKCPLKEDDFKAFVHDRLAPYKRPARIIVATDLPAAPTGKIIKARLIETFARELDESR